MTAWALVAVGVGCALGEGAAVFAALSLCAVALARAPAHAWRVHLSESWPLWGLLLGSVAAALASPWGFRGSALGHAAPWALPAVVQVALHGHPAQKATRAACAFVCVVLLGGVLCWGLGTYGIDVHLAWGHGAARSHRQGFLPGTDRLGVGGWYGHRLKMASALMVAAHLCQGAWLARARWPRGANVWSARLALGGLVASMGLLAATQARAHAAACLIASAVVVLIARGRPRRIQTVVAITGLSLVALGAFVLLAPHGHATPRAGIGERAPLWRCGLSVWSAHPYGVGLGNVPQAMATCLQAQAPLTRSPRTGPHQSVLGLGLMAGGWGIGLMAVFYAARVRRCVRTLRARTDSQASQAAAACALGLILSFGLVGLLHDALHHAITTWTFFAALGACEACMAPSSPKERT